MSFEAYLHKRRLRPASIRTYRWYMSVFFRWLEAEGLPAPAVTYPDLLNLLRYCYNQGCGRTYTGRLLGVVRHYYNYLKHEGEVTDNPAAGLYTRRPNQRLPHDLLSEEELTELYHSFAYTTSAGHRDKVMLGIMIYQGGTTRELAKLTPEDVNLHEATITLPATTRSNARRIGLEACQVLDMQTYLDTSRPQLLSHSNKTSARLFMSAGRREDLHNSLPRLMDKLRKAYDARITARRLRQSRLVLWAGLYDIRKAQYLAGHKYVSSTERYQSCALEALKEDLDQYHPLR